jgi:hypothetical protein
MEVVEPDSSQYDASSRVYCIVASQRPGLELRKILIILGSSCVQSKTAQGYAKKMLAKYPDSKDWRNVRFSDEVHFGYGPAGRIYVTRRPGEITCPECVQQADTPPEKDQKRVHAWGAIGYNFKSKLYRYDAGNSNGKMAQQIYPTLLEQEVAFWPANAVLEEDGDSGHGKSVARST